MAGQLNYPTAQEQPAELHTETRRAGLGLSHPRRRIGVLVAVTAALAAIAGPPASVARSARPAAPTPQASGLGNCLVDPYTPASACYRAAGIPVPTTAPSSCSPAHGTPQDRIRPRPRGRINP